MAVETTAPTIKLITGDELLVMGDIGPCELVEGRIVPGRYHNVIQAGVISEICWAVADCVRSRKLGAVQVGEVGIYTRRNPDTVRGADVLFISNERMAQVRPRGYLDVAPDLVVEVMSPDDRWSEVNQKLREYFEIGVRLVWVGDPDTRTVYAYRSLSDVRVFTKSDTLVGDDVLPGFSVPVASLFEES